MSSTFLNNTPAQFGSNLPKGEFLKLDGEWYYKITDVDKMDVFFISVVSPYDHWMFVGSNGGITAGRGNSDNALFPYYTHDKIIDTAGITGSKTLLKVVKDGKTYLWEPCMFEDKGIYNVQRNILKNDTGNRLIFEIINRDLGLIWSFEWTSSDESGFIKRSWIENLGDEELEIECLDGIQNILPAGINQGLQEIRSNLVDGYKQAELLDGPAAVFSLGARIVDRAEPSESLDSTLVYCAGISPTNILLSTSQVSKFERGEALTTEDYITGLKGAFFLSTTLSLKPGDHSTWCIISDVSMKAADVVLRMEKGIGANRKVEDLIDEIKKSTHDLRHLVGLADGLMKTGKNVMDARHYSNVLFNIMRGGIFKNGYKIQKSQLVEEVQHFNPSVYSSNEEFFKNLPESLTYNELFDSVKGMNPDLVRLCTHHLPLSFSRRHGDPSRPWNRFNVTSSKEGDKISFEGNWRDIFQNWEALSYSYPYFVFGMIHRFLNASTIDGYNPYRITNNGVDWEVEEPHDLWSFIGYWGDHQIIYLLRLLEVCNKYFPIGLAELNRGEQFVFTDLPYRIKGFESILADPRSTIVYDRTVEAEIAARMEENGADGNLVFSEGRILHASLLDKLLLTLFVKMSNFVPDGGIWLNTQRPEWNDANNALAGNGLSMVTVYHLKSYLNFIEDWIDGLNGDIQLNKQLKEFFMSVSKALLPYNSSNSISASTRFEIVRNLGVAGETYRSSVYRAPSPERASVSKSDLKSWLNTVLTSVSKTIEGNKTEDGLYHSYNTLSYSNGEIRVENLYIMLEGQVAAFNQVRNAEEFKTVMSKLKASALYRKDQRSYMLYPDRRLPKFLEKGIIPKDRVESSKLLQALIDYKNESLVNVDARDIVRFAPSLHNDRDVQDVLDELRSDSKYSELVDAESALIREIYESVFNHASFTGRSGTFFAYEGLGSIYWHMVSKLHLAALEKALVLDLSDEECAEIYELGKELREGIGMFKSPIEYGGFPIDPYSHTPKHTGVQQPGMTGQVKEDIIARWAELGVVVLGGKLSFNPISLPREQFTNEPRVFRYVDTFGEYNRIDVEPHTLNFSYMGTHIQYVQGEVQEIILTSQTGAQTTLEGHELSNDDSQKLFRRTGEIRRVRVVLERKRVEG
ncbi:MAG: hypothetical protein HWE14_01060 [Flavobacteriia bacterium]|nr:hypothetical protein [Flavobacteriia bacterium]